jgi:hypothetical protein
MFMHRTGVILCIICSIYYRRDNIRELFADFLCGVMLVAITLLHPPCALSIPFKSEEE